MLICAWPWEIESKVSQNSDQWKDKTMNSQVYFPNCHTTVFPSTILIDSLVFIPRYICIVPIKRCHSSPESKVHSKWSLVSPLTKIPTKDLILFANGKQPKAPSGTNSAKKKNVSVHQRRPLTKSKSFIKTKTNK